MRVLLLALALHFGSTVPPQPPGGDSTKYKYLTVEDTYLDPAKPGANFGADERLLLGGGRVVLIRYSDLLRAVGAGKEPSEAGILLHTVAPVRGKPRFTVRRLRVPWGEGAGPEDPTRWCATWKMRRTPVGAGGHAWSKPGAGPADTLPSAGRVEVQGGFLVVRGLEADVRDMIGREWANFGWVITCDAAKPIALYSSQSAQEKMRPEMRLGLVAAGPAPKDYDLSVAYIERLPEYPRYDPSGDAYTYKKVRGTDVGLMDHPGLADKQKWPKDGETVTFIAHVRNNGTKPVTGFTYTWSVNEEPRAGETFSGTLAPGGETTVKTAWEWHANHADHRDQTVSIRVEAPKGVREASLNNNVLTDYAEAMQMGFYVEKRFLAEFQKQRNGSGTSSFYDWLQWQLRIWNEVFMARSRYPGMAPDGSLERVRAQRVTVAEDGVLQGGVHVPNDKTDFRYDGEWGFAWNASNDQDSINYINAIRNGVERGFLHESSHQMGLNDVYVQDIDASLPDGTRGKVRLKAGTGHVITRGFIDPYPYSGLMGGGDTRPHRYAKVNGQIGVVNLEPEMNAESYDLYASIDVGGLNSDLGSRRGFFGEYMYDLPANIALKVVDAAGDPIPRARLFIYQERGGAIEDDPPVFTGLTSFTGNFALRDQPTLEDGPVTTATGHTLRPNPWGRIDVVGGNGVFLINAQAYGQSEWQFVKLHELNVARWLGNKGTFTYTVKMNIAPTRIDPANAALGKTVKDSRGPGQDSNASNLTDGRLDSRWFAGDKPGGFVQIDLGEEVDVAEVRLIQNGSQGDFWQQFRIEVGVNPMTMGKAQPENIFATEPSWGWTAGHKRDVDPKDFEVWTVTYRNKPLKGRLVRITNLSGGSGTLTEVEVRGASAGPE